MPLAGKTRKEVVTEFREAEILTAARQVFARRGFAEASMEEISQAAGLAKGTLYLYYPSKQDLHRAAIRSGLTDLCETLERGLLAAPSVAARIQAYVATKVGYFEEHRDFFRMYMAEFGNAACGAMNPDFKDLAQRQTQTLARAIREGLKGKGAVAAEDAAHAIADLTRGVILRRLMGWTDAKSVEKEVAFVVDFAKKALGCR
jgi:TetR/AcrR family transcriptional regulator, fatty acid metabolism regulator protein